MKSIQSAQINMFRVVENTCDANTAAWSGLAVFSTAKATLSANIGAITTAIGRQGAGTKGATFQKRNYRKAMETDLVTLAAAVQLYYRFSGDEAAAREVSFSPSSLTLMGDDALLGLASRIVGMADTIGLTGLGPYGVDSAFRTAFGLKLDNYRDSIDDPRQALAERRQATADIARLIRETATLLDTQMDVATELIRAAQPDFYGEYWFSRRIKDAPHTPRTLTVRVVDGATGKALANVQASLMPGKLKRKTGAAGQFYVQTLATGTYTLTLVRAGYATATQEVQVEKGGRAMVEVGMMAE